MAGIEDVARLAGVSKSTVSRAYNGHSYVSAKTVRNVLEAALKLGYVPSSSAYTLATGLNRNIGVVLPYVDRWYFGSVLAGIQSRLIAAGYDLTLYNFNGDLDQRSTIFTDFVLRKRVDAILTISLKLTSAELNTLKQLNKPVLAIGGPVEGAQSISIDDFGAAKLATMHLISLGHRKIALIGGDAESEMDFHQPASRRAGYLSALAEASIEVNEDWIIPSNFTLPGGYEAAKIALSDPRVHFSAMFAASDEMAIGAIMAARDLGLRVPEDVSIVGIDGHSLSEFFGLTTIAQDPEKQGSKAASLILDLLTGVQMEEGPDTHWPIRLVVRSSTARYQGG